MNGIVIKKHRLEQNMSQSGLCEGICAVSYLSKIEQNKVEPSYEILWLLLDRLGLEIPKKPLDCYEYKYRIYDVIKNLEMGFEEVARESYQALKGEAHIFNIMELSIDWWLLEGYYLYDDNLLEDLSCKLKAIEGFKDVLTRLQRSHYHILNGFYFLEINQHEKAIKNFQECLGLRRDGLTLSYLAFANFSAGKYITTVTLGDKAYQKLVEEGNMYQAVNISLSVAAACSNSQQISKAIKIYERLLNINRYYRRSGLDQDIYYNLGATYIMNSHYKEGLEYLLKCFNDPQNKASYKQILLYQKITLAYIGLGDQKQGQAWIKKVLDLSQALTLDRNSSLYASIRWLSIYYDKSPETLEWISKTYEASKKDAHFGFQLFYGNYYIEALKNHRKYKEALEVSEALKLS